MTADPQQNECELIISLLAQEHGPTLLLSAPVMDTDATTANWEKVLDFVAMGRTEKV